MTTSYFVRRLSWQPVQHACEHYEIRLMAHSDSPVQAESPCSSCAPQGRPVQTRYDTPTDALDAATLKNAQQRR